jgi:hypothetical protein
MGGLSSAAAILWTLALAIGSADGLYLHLWRYRLYARSQTRLEHLAHTGRALLLPPILYLALLGIGIPLTTRIGWLVGLSAADWTIGIWDALLEKRSREASGGLPHHEYLVHLIATGLHSGAEVLSVASLSVALMSMETSSTFSSPRLASLTGFVLVPMSAVVAVVHAVLLHPRFTQPRGIG